MLGGLLVENLKISPELFIPQMCLSYQKKGYLQSESKFLVE